MKKIISFIILLSLVSCEGIHYEGETKLVIKGVIVDENNQPISNNEVKLIVSTSGQESFIFSNASEINYIGRTTSKEDGSYVMVIPEPSNFGQIVVETNSEGNLFNQKQFTNIQLSNFVNYELLLPQTKLFKNADLSLLNVTSNQINTNYQLQKLEYIGAVANEVQAMNPYEESYYPYNTSVQVKKNQTIVLKYTVKNLITNELVVSEQNVTIGNDSETNYTLNY